MDNESDPQKQGQFIYSLDEIPTIGTRLVNVVSPSRRKSTLFFIITDCCLVINHIKKFNFKTIAAAEIVKNRYSIRIFGDFWKLITLLLR